MLRITVALTLASLPALAGDPDVYVLTMSGNPGIASSSHTFDELAEPVSGIGDLREGASIREALLPGPRLEFELVGPEGEVLFVDGADPSDNEILLITDLALPGPIPRVLLETASLTIGFASEPERTLEYVDSLLVGAGQFSMRYDVGTNLQPLGSFSPRVSIKLFFEGSDWQSGAELANRLTFSVDFDAQANGASFCAGDGSATPCPCGNVAEEGRGCAHSSGVGARLSAAGESSLAEDTLFFDLEGGPAGSFAVLMSAVGQLNDGLGIRGTPPMDGLRCIGGGMIRHGARAIDATGSIVQPWDQAGQGGIVSNLGAPAGSVRHFQAYLRDLPEATCGTGINTTNAVSILVAP